MHESRPLRRENRSLWDRFLRLSSTVLRINSSLDLDTVLREVVDSACALTGAAQCVIPTIDRSGRLVDYLTSGVSDDASQAMVAWPEGPGLLEHLRDIQEPFQLADFPGYLESRGFPPGPWPTHTLQAAPMRHRGQHLGQFFIDKADGAARTQGSQFHGHHKAFKGRMPHKRAILATAHKFLRTIVAMLRDNRPHIDPGTDYDKLLVDCNAARWLRKLEELRLSAEHPLRGGAGGSLTPTPFLPPSTVPLRSRGH